MGIRRAVVADIPAMEVLLQEILEVHHAIRPDLFQARGMKYSRAELEALIEDEGNPIFVYDDEGVKGHLFLQIKESKAASQVAHKTLFIDDLCVAKAARGQGIGSKLYEFAEDYARQLGCYNLTLHAWSGNDDALRFYEKVGLKPQYVSLETVL